jgi:hypothetical protein
VKFTSGGVDGELMRTLLAAAALLACALVSSAFTSPAFADSMIPKPPQAAPRGAPNSIVELDTSGSGGIDYRVYYDQRGKVAQEEMDYNHRGRMDTFYYYKDGVLQRVEIDSKGSGKIDIWVYVKDGTYVSRYERDTTGTGKPDLVRNFGVN